MPREETPPNSLEDVDENLRRAYKELLNEALPPRFADLLDQLRNGVHSDNHLSEDEGD